MQRNSLSCFIGQLRARLDMALGFPNLRKRYNASVGKDPNLSNPRGFAEKIQWRKVYDRNPLFPVFVDKIRVRDFVRDRIGEERAKDLLPRLIWQGGRPEDIPFDQLTGGVVIKANHGCGWNILLGPEDTPDRRTVIRTCRKWLRTCFGQPWHEWAYSQVAPRILVEEQVRQDDGSGILELKLYVFDGKIARLTLVDYTGDVGRHHLLTPDWERVNGSYHLGIHFDWGPVEGFDKPPYLDDLLEVARKLGAGVDMVRIDFMVSRTRYWIGEMTIYPASGNCFFKPSALEREMGDRWRLPGENLRPGAPMPLINGARGSRTPDRPR